jgi:hypothetical protein
LRRLEPVHVISNIVHASAELFTGNLQSRETLGDSSPFAARKLRDDLLVFAGDRAQNGIRLPNKQKQSLTHLNERCSFGWRRLLSGEVAKIRRFASVRGFDAQQFVKASFAFVKRE